MNLHEFPEGVYLLRQEFYGDGSQSTGLTPLKKRWWIFGRYIIDRQRAEALKQLVVLDEEARR